MPARTWPIPDSHLQGDPTLLGQNPRLCGGPFSWRAMCSHLIPRLSNGISHCPLYHFGPAAGVNLSKDYPCNRGPGPNTSRPHSPPLSSQQPREGSPEQEVLRQGVGRDFQEGSPAPMSRNSYCSPRLQVEEEANLQGRSTGPMTEALSPATATL